MPTSVQTFRVWSSVHWKKLSVFIIICWFFLDVPDQYRYFDLHVTWYLHSQVKYVCFDIPYSWGFRVRQYQVLGLLHFVIANATVRCVDFFIVYRVGMLSVFDEEIKPNSVCVYLVIIIMVTIYYRNFYCLFGNVSVLQRRTARQYESVYFIFVHPFIGL